MSSSFKLSRFAHRVDVGKADGYYHSINGNVVILLALKKLSNEDRDKLDVIFNEESVGEEDVKNALRLIKKADVKDEVEKMADDFIDKAKENLAKLPQNEWTIVLSDLADYIVSREK